MTLKMVEDVGEGERELFLWGGGRRGLFCRPICGLAAACLEGRRHLIDEREPEHVVEALSAQERKATERTAEDQLVKSVAARGALVPGRGDVEDAVKEPNRRVRDEAVAHVLEAH